MASTSLPPIPPTASFPDLRLAVVSVSEGRHLPRWETSGAIYHVALHLADSIPAAQRRIWLETRAELQSRLKRGNRPMTEDEREVLKSVYDARIERYLASGYGTCLLRDPTVQQIVRKILVHGNGKDYTLHAWCLMPNHLHVIVGACSSTAPLSRTLSTWKRVSGHRINKQLNREGPVWQADSYTHIIRNEIEYKAQLNYVWRNPESAGLTAGFTRETYVPVCA